MKHLWSLVIIIAFIFACKKADVDTETGTPLTWAKKADFPAIGRHHPITFTIGNDGFTGLGSAGTNYYNDFYKYSPTSNTWTKLNNFPGKTRGYSYGVSYNGKGYVGFGENNGTFFGDLWQYDPSKDSWTALAICPCEPRTHPAMIVINNKIYVGMGGGRTQNLNDWWEYDISKNSWIQRPSLIGATRHHPFFFEIGTNAYVGFGHGSELVNNNYIYNDFYEYDTNTNIWKKLKNFPSQGRVAGTQFTYNGNGYILSGQGEMHQYLDKGEFWKYNPKTDSWTELTPHEAGSRWAPGSFIINNKLYFTNGEDKTGFPKNLLEFTLD